MNQISVSVRRPRMRVRPRRTRRLGLRVVTAVAILLSSTIGWSDDSTSFVFERLSMREGLSQNTVLATLQDQQGFVWLATENGLNRFDGYTFKTYYRDRFSKGGLSSDYIWAMAEDSRGDLWLATNDAGVVRWQRDTDSFRPVLAPTADGALERRRSSALIIARNGEIWVGTRGAGVYVLGPDGGLRAEYSVHSDSGLRLAGNDVTAMIEAKDGAIWVGTRTGLNRIDPSRKSIRVFQRQEMQGANGLPSNIVSSLLQSRDGSIWVGTSDAGAARWRPETESFEVFGQSGQKNAGLAHPEVRSLMEDQAGRLWFATQRGLTVYEPRDGRVHQIRHQPENPLSLANDFVMSLYQDRSGLIWIGTRGGGVSRWNPRSWSLGPRLPGYLSGVHVNAFTEGPDHEIWMGTIGAGLVRLDAAGRRVGGAGLADGLPALPDRRIMSLLNDGQGDIWIGTLKGGVLRYTPATGQLKRLPVQADAPDALGAVGVMSLLRTRDGSVWVGTFDGGVSRIDPETQKIERVAWGSEHVDLTQARATALAEGPEGELWIGTEDLGLVRLDQSSGEIRRFRRNPDEQHSLPSETIYSIHVDDAGDVWLGTAGYGLARLTRTSLASGQPRFTRMNKASGLSSNVIYGIQPDADGQLWLSSNNGLMRLDPKTQRLRIFRQEHGAYAEEFNFGAHYAAPNGRLYFGGIGGFNVVDPARIENLSRPPRVVLTKVERYNQAFDLGVPPEQLRRLVLDHDDDMITFEFAALDFSAPDKNLYSVLLQGFDGRWSAPSSRRSASYTDLDAGSYVFRVRAQNSDGHWSDQSLDVNVVVNPAPWATWWARLVYALIALLFLWALLRWSYRSQERKARLQQLAYYDALTGIPNRDLFKLRANEALRRVERDKETLAVISLRIGVPKQFVDTLGSKGKDDLYRGLVDDFMRIIHGGTVPVGRQDLARLDSDEFGVFVRAPYAEMSAVMLAQKLTGIASQPVSVGSHRVPINLYAGIACFPEHGKDLASLVKYAGTAANEQAQQRKSGLVVYQKAMTQRASMRLELESGLRDAIDQDRLQLYYQPKYSVDGDILGAEALLRWQHETRGWISPVEFVALAEESDLIFALDCWVIERACKDMQRWHQQLGRVVPIAVNVSGANLGDDRIVQAFAENCRRYAVKPSWIEIELTESALMRDLDAVRRVVEALKQKGFTIALDDFGTGYSSLVHLQHFAIDTLKIDRAFVRDVDSQPERASICRGVLALAQSLGIGTVAEGVETEAEKQLLAQLNCDVFQGYLFSKPVEEGVFFKMCEAQVRRDAQLVS